MLGALGHLRRGLAAVLARGPSPRTPTLPVPVSRSGFLPAVVTDPERAGICRKMMWL
jgi:hypothetical protein